MRGLKAKRVLVTGGASGIGAATAARFHEEGSVVCVLDCDAEARRKTLRDLPGLAAALDADVSNLKQVQSAFAEAVRLMGGVDVLVNNAGISIRHNFLDITPEEWDKVMAVNLTGVFYVAQTAARHMMERGSGVILQTASTNGVMGYPFYADYNATKAGVIELTKSMALELGVMLSRKKLRRSSHSSPPTMRKISPVTCIHATAEKPREGWPAGKPCNFLEKLR